MSKSLSRAFQEEYNTSKNVLLGDYRMDMWSKPVCKGTPTATS